MLFLLLSTNSIYLQKELKVETTELLLPLSIISAFELELRPRRLCLRMAPFRWKLFAHSLLKLRPLLQYWTVHSYEDVKSKKQISKLIILILWISPLNLTKSSKYLWLNPLKTKRKKKLTYLSKIHKPNNLQSTK